MEEFIGQVRRAMPERYVVEREWGAGGAAIVYLAEDVKHECKVAGRRSSQDEPGCIAAGFAWYEVG